MAKTLVKNYTLNVSAKTITFTDFTTILLKNVLLVTDITTTATIYQFNTNGPGASVSGNVLTLNTIPNSAANTDTLQIFYDAQAGDPTTGTQDLPNGASTSALQTAGNTSLSSIATNTGVAQGSTTTGQNGPLAQGAVLTANPTYTSGQTAPLSLMPSGKLRIAGNGMGASSVPTDIFYIGMLNTTGNLNGLTSQDRGDGQTQILQITDGVYNGTSVDRSRTAGAAVAAGTGTPAVAPVPAANSLGLTTYFNASITGATATAIKTTAGRLHKFYIYNPNASVTFLQVFDLATGSVTVGTTTPKQSYAIPPNGVFEDFFEFSDAFTTAITIATTTTVTGNTAPSTALVINLGYI